MVAPRSLPWRQDPLLHWEGPVTDWGPAPLDWLHPLIPYWVALTDLIEPFIKDPLVQRHWSNLVDQLDTADPQNPEEANRVFRECVVGVWRILEAHEQRQRKRPISVP